MVWLPRSPDFTPTDFFLWGHIKALIYTSLFHSEEDLIDRIVEVAATWHFQTHMSVVSLCCIIGCVKRSVAVHLNICSKFL